MISRDKIFCHKNFRGTCSSVKMLKGYIVRERLGTLLYIIKCVVVFQNFRVK